MTRSRNKKSEGPKFVRFFGPLLAALDELGGSGRPAEVFDQIADKTGLTEEERSEVLKSGNLRFNNQVYWAKFYLAKLGYVEASEHGVWRLTEEAKRHLNDSPSDWLSRFHEVQSTFKPGDKVEEPEEAALGEEPAPQSTDIATDYRSQLQTILSKLSPSGFENLCKRLLRESGFEKVIVTGKSGDGGIDGHGILQLNPFVSFKVLFQCKRYAGSVSSSQVRDFRGAMTGRADKGIIITTGTFSPSAQAEALRDGAPPIELVDQEKLLQMFEILKLRLRPRTTFDVDTEFFKEFA